MMIDLICSSVAMLSSSVHALIGMLAYATIQKWVLEAPNRLAQTIFLYIASTTPGEILHMLKDKYKINIYLQDKYPQDPGGRDICHCHIKQYLEKLYEKMLICCSTTNFQQIYIFCLKSSSY